MNYEEYLLTKLAQEANEVAHRVSKALLFGAREVQPGQPLNNVERIADELEDVAVIVEMLQEQGILPADIRRRDRMLEKRRRVEKYMEYSRECGTLRDAPPGS